MLVSPVPAQLGTHISNGLSLCGEALSVVQARMATRDSSHRHSHSADGVLGVPDLAAGARGLGSCPLWGHWGSGCRAEGVMQDISMRPWPCTPKHRSSHCERTRKRCAWRNSLCPSHCCKDVSVRCGGVCAGPDAGVCDSVQPGGHQVHHPAPGHVGEPAARHGWRGRQPHAVRPHSRARQPGSGPGDSQRLLWCLPGPTPPLQQQQH